MTEYTHTVLIGLGVLGWHQWFHYRQTRPRQTYSPAKIHTFQDVWTQVTNAGRSGGEKDSIEIVVSQPFNDFNQLLEAKQKDEGVIPLKRPFFQTAKSLTFQSLNVSQYKLRVGTMNNLISRYELFDITEVVHFIMYLFWLEIQIVKYIYSQTHPFMSLWTLFCALVNSHAGIEKGLPQTVPTKLEAQHCPKCLGILRN